MTLKNILSPIETELATVQSIIATQIKTESSILLEIADHILESKGKFIRPAVTLLSYLSANRKPISLKMY